MKPFLRVPVAIGAAALMVAGGAAAVPTAPAAADTGEPIPRVILRASDVEGEISPTLFGANHRYAYDGFGSLDTANGAAYPQFVEQVQAAGITAIRYPGGTIANLFRWQDSIGPVADRKVSPHGGPLGEPLTAEFGPDEFGRLLEQTGAVGSIVVNFATGTSAEAADWVEYMTAPVGTNPRSGIAWADVRAAYGHPDPYDVPYWEVANEPYLDYQYYWRGGVSPKTPAQLYADGGTTTFTGQRAAREGDYRVEAAESDGNPDQEFVARFAPIEAEGLVVKVGGQAWQEVVDIAVAGPTPAYEVDRASGRIRFGDGENGLIPPDGAVVTVDYTSGPHEGFVDFYAAMKEANPQAKICIGAANHAYIKAMGPDKPYDCAVKHPYVGLNGAGLSLDEFRTSFLSKAADQVSAVAQAQADIRRFAGEDADDIEVILSEYGHLAKSNPPSVTHYHRTLDQGLYNAEFLRRLIELGGVDVAMRHALVDYILEDAPEGSLDVGSPDNAIIAGPGPDTVPQAQAHVFTLLTKMTGRHHVASEVLDAPVHTAGAASMETLTTLATRDDDGNLYALVINLDAASDITARVTPVDFARAGETAEVWTVTGDELLSINTAENPDAVSISTATLPVTGAEFTHTFPARSVTAIKLMGDSIASTLDVHAMTPGVSEPGTSFDLTATATSSAAEPQTVTLSPSVPEGWTVSPASQEVTLAHGSSATRTFSVTVPSAAPVRGYGLDVTAVTGTHVRDVARAAVTIRTARAGSTLVDDTFDQDTAGTPPAGWTVSSEATVTASLVDERRTMALQRTSAGSSVVSAVRTAGSSSADLRVSATVRADQTDQALGLHLLNGADQTVARVSLAANGRVSYTQGASFVSTAVSYPAGSWRELEITLDRSAGTYDVRFGAHTVIAGAALERPAPDVAKVRVQIPSTSTGVSRFDIDRVTVSDLAEE